MKRTPLGDITNIIRKPYNRSKKPESSDSSIGSTPNPIRIHRPITSPSDNLVDDENQIAYARRQNTRSKAKADVSFNKISIQETKNYVKEKSAPLCSSTLDKIKDQGQGKVRWSCLDKTTNDGTRMSVVPSYASTENVKDQGKAVDMPSSTHHMKNLTNNTNTRNTRSAMKIKDRGNESADVAITMLKTPMKKLDKGKAIAVSPDYPSRKNLRNNMMEIRVPLKGVVIKEGGETYKSSSYSSIEKTNNKTGDKTGATMPNSLTKKMHEGKEIAIPVKYSVMKTKDRGETVGDSGCADPGEKNKGMAVGTPIGYRSLEKNDKRGSCPPLLRTAKNRNKADDVEDLLQFKPRTEPPPNKKKRRCLSKALPRDYVEQQRAYFKEIDDFELEIEEV